MKLAISSFAALSLLLLSETAFAQPAGYILPDDAQQLTPHVYVIRGFPNVAIIVGSGGTLVVDTGLGPSNGATVARVAVKLAKAPRLYLTTTHFHPEHAAGEGGFPSGTILIRAKAQQDELIQDRAQMLGRFQQRPAFANLLQNATFRNPDITFDSDYSLNLGDTNALLVYRGPAHTRGDEEVFVREDSVLVTGDVVQNKTGPAFTAKGIGPAEWLATVRALEPLHPRIIVPDHSPPGDGPTLISQEEGFLKTLIDRADELKSKGVSVVQAGQMVTQEFKGRYPDWNIGDLSDAVARCYQ